MKLIHIFSETRYDDYFKTSDERAEELIKYIQKEGHFTLKDSVKQEILVTYKKFFKGRENGLKYADCEIIDIDELPCL